jgi:hypothetical protein
MVATIAFLVLTIAALVALGTAPQARDSGTVVISWFHDHGAHVRWATWFLTLGLMAFGVYAALLRDALPAPHRDVFFFGAIAFAVETAVQSWFLAALSWHGAALAPATARTVLDIANFWGPVLTSTTVLMLAPVMLLAFGDGARFPTWLGVVTAIAVAEQLVETVTIFGTRGFIAPGGPMNLELGAALTIIALVCIGFAVARDQQGRIERSRPEPSTVMP